MKAACTDEERSKRCQSAAKSLLHRKPIHKKAYRKKQVSNVQYVPIIRPIEEIPQKVPKTSQDTVDLMVPDPSHYKESDHDDDTDGNHCPA